jgi:energy-coupling factor transporter ATP-binding protein EcfA2
MKAVVCCFAAACALLLMPRPTAGQDKNAEDDMMKKWLAASTPGPDQMIAEMVYTRRK